MPACTRVVCRFSAVGVLRFSGLDQIKVSHVRERSFTHDIVVELRFRGDKGTVVGVEGEDAVADAPLREIVIGVDSLYEVRVRHQVIPAQRSWRGVKACALKELPHFFLSIVPGQSLPGQWHDRFKRRRREGVQPAAKVFQSEAIAKSEKKGPVFGQALRKRLQKGRNVRRDLHKIDRGDKVEALILSGPAFQHIGKLRGPCRPDPLEVGRQQRLEDVDIGPAKQRVFPFLEGVPVQQRLSQRVNLLRDFHGQCSCGWTFRYCFAVSGSCRFSDSVVSIQGRCSIGLCAQSSYAVWRTQ